MERERDIFDHWLEKQVKRIKNDAVSMKSGLFPETIHRFRTGTKRLRAVMRLAPDESGKTVKLPHDFRKLYRLSGELRDRQVLLQMIVEDKDHILPAFAIWLSHKIGEAGQKLGHQHTGQAMQKLDQHAAHAETIPDIPMLSLWYSERLQKIKAMILNDADDEVLHEIRKMAKDMEYVLEFCKKKWPAAYEMLITLEASLKNLSDKAGIYNDRRNLLDVLEQFKAEWGRELEADEEKKLAEAKKDWQKAKTAERRALLTAIRRLINQKAGL